MALEFPLAGIGSRFLALFADTLLQAALFIVLMFATIWTGLSQIAGASQLAAVAFILGSFLLYFGYFAFFEALWRGQTPGKRWMGLRVIKDSGRPVTVYESIARNLVRLVDQLPGIYAVGILAALLHPQNKRLGDMVAGTVVVREKAFEQLQPGWDVFRPAAAEPAAFDATRLTAEQLQLIETFLQRRPQLPARVRFEAAGAIAERIGAALGVPPAERTGPETFLEKVAQAARNRPSYR